MGLSPLTCFLIALSGYAIGRIGHVYLDHVKSPHHWIYGIILMIVGTIFHRYFLGPIAFYFGIGHFISDFKDFLNLKIYGRDEEGKKKFWGID